MSSSSKPLPPDAEDIVFACLESEDPQAALAKICREHPEHAATWRSIFDGLREHGLLEGSGSRATDPPGVRADQPERLGPYRILERLGHGGMGVVFLGIDESLGRRVAIKLIRPEQLYVPGNKERFKREVDALLDLSHPGIVRVLGAGEDEGIPWYAMEFVEGLSLAEVVRRFSHEPPASLTGKSLLTMLESGVPKGSSSSGTRLTDELARLDWPAVCIRLISEAAEALQHAHEQQIIHRDVKPSNLLLTQSGHLRLVDFGLARIEDGQSLTGSTAELGSLPYLAPEYLGGPADRLDPRQDVYSLGVTLYELLTLHCPYLGRDQEETRRLIREAHPPDPRRLNSRISWDLATVCLTAMDPDPARRYQSCADFLQDLSNLRSKRPILATRPKPLLRLRRWAERHPRASAVAATGVLLLLVSGFLYGLSESKARRQIEALYEKARYSNYIANLRTAKMDISTNEIADGKFRLLNCPEDMRGIEWNILARRMDQSRRILSRKTYPIINMAVSDDGRLLANIDLNYRLQVIRLQDGKTADIPVDPARFIRLRFLPKTHHLALGSKDGSVQIFDVDERKVLAELPRPTPEAGPVSTLCYLKKLDLLAVAYGEGWIHLWDIPSMTSRYSRRVHMGSVQVLASNADSTRLLSTSVDSTAKLLTLPDLVEKASVKHETWIVGGTIPEKGNVWLSGSQDGAVIETGIDSGKSRTLIQGRSGHSRAVIMFLPDKRNVISGGVAIEWRNLDYPSLGEKQLGHQSTVLCLAAGSTGKVIFSGSEDGTVREWSVAPHGMIRTVADAQNAIRAVAWMDPERWIAGNSKGKLLRGGVDGATKVRVQTLKGGGILDMTPLSTKEFVVSMEDASLAFFRWSDQEPWYRLRLDSPVQTLQPFGDTLLALTREGRILEIKRAQQGWTASAIDLETRVCTMASAGAKQWIYWAGEDRILHVMDRTGREVPSPPLEHLRVVKLRPLADHTRIGIEDSDHVIRILDPSDSSITHTLEGHTRELDSIQLRPGSSRLVSSGKHERKIMIWDATHETRLLNIDLPHSSLDMALDPTGEKILVGMMWGLVSLCDASALSRPLELTKPTRSTPEGSQRRRGH